MFFGDPLLLLRHPPTSGDTLPYLFLKKNQKNMAKFRRPDLDLAAFFLISKECGAPYLGAPEKYFPWRTQLGAP
jgi:hypothetical protein